MSEKPQVEYPCDYPIKIIVKNAENIDARIIAIINQHQEKLFEGQLTQKLSKEKNYLSISLTVFATSQEQLVGLFEDLRKDPDVMMIL